MLKYPMLKTVGKEYKGQTHLQLDFDDTRLVSIAVYNGHPSIGIHELTLDELKIIEVAIKERVRFLEMPK